MFSAAVRAGNRLYCWKTKPMLRPRNRVFSRSRIAVISWPNTDTVPSSASRIPAMTESKVVLPQPEGPTINDICPLYTSQSTAQGQHPLVTTTEMLGHPPDPDGHTFLGRGLQSSALGHGGSAPLRSTLEPRAGSRTVRRLMLRGPEKMQIKTMALPGIGWNGRRAVNDEFARYPESKGPHKEFARWVWELIVLAPDSVSAGYPGGSGRYPRGPG